MNYSIYEKHCCNCKIKYHKYSMKHCCKCKMIYITDMYHCCYCKRNYIKYYDHCCIHDIAYKKNTNCSICIIHKKIHEKLYQDIIYELEYYPNIGIKYFEAKNDYDTYL